MCNKTFRKWIKCFPIYFFPLFALLPITSHASIIESTTGTAVINDATAVYYNPAALVLLKNPQIITLGTRGYFRSRFIGQTIQVSTGYTQTGSSSSHSYYDSPSLYLGMPATDKVTIGLAIVSNSAERNAEDTAILRYVQSSNNIQDFDVVPGVAVKINEFCSLGAGVNFSYADFHLKPIIGFPSSNIADSESDNQSDGTGVGANIGFLLKPTPKTLIGFNYRSSTTYKLSGKSVFNGTTQVVSNNYQFKVWTPARSVLSITHFVTPALGFISTIQRMQWSIYQNINVQGIAALSGSQPVFLNGSIPYYLNDTWLLTLGSNYRFAPKWIMRVAGTYNQSPASGHYQISNGDSIIFGTSLGYDVNKSITIDGGYAHAFIKDQKIDITSGRYLTNGVNEGSRDAFSLKLTFNV